jgi:nitrogen-specific signal transduction histidine kinase
MPGWAQLLVVAACVTCGSFAWLERRRTQLLRRQIKQLTQVSSQSEDPAFQPRTIPHPNGSEELRRLKHDVKNPLTSILCFCALLRKSAGLTARQADYVDKIQHSANGIVLLLESMAEGDPQPEPREQENINPIERTGAVP